MSAARTVGWLWIVAVYVAPFAWISHFGFPHSHNPASIAACVITGSIVIALGVVFAVIVGCAVVDGKR